MVFYNIFAALVLFTILAWTYNVDKKMLHSFLSHTLSGMYHMLFYFSK